MSQTVVTSRIAWIDNAKTFAMFSVVFGHVNGLFNHDMPYFSTINEFIVSFNMYLFVFLSGITCYRSLSQVNDIKKYMAYIKKMILRIGLPFLSILVIESLILGHFSLSGGPWFLRFFLKLVICAATCFLLVSYIKNEKIRKIIFIVLFNIACLFISKRYTAEFGLSFTLGMLLPMGGGGKNIENVKTWNLKTVILVIGLSLIFVSGLYLTGQKSFYTHSLYELVQQKELWVFGVRQVTALCAIVMTVLLMVRYTNRYTAISEYGSKTLGIYIIHGLMVLTYKHFDNTTLSMLPSSAYMWIVAFATSVIVWYISLYIEKLISKNKYLALVFLGK